MEKVLWRKPKNSLENTCDVFFTPDLERFFKKKKEKKILWLFLII